MSDPDSPSPSQPPQPRFDLPVGQSIYATGLIVIHTRDEFLFDFISGLDTPAKLAGRVLATPPHAKRMLRALLENFGRYEHSYGAVAPQVANSRARPGQVKDIYGQLQISEEILRGAFANGMVVKHTQDVFVMDFTLNFPPSAKVTSRVLVSPAHLRRITGVLGDNIAQYEERFGKIDDGGSPTEQPLWISLN
jgi:hypothetical protein